MDPAATTNEAVEAGTSEAAAHVVAPVDVAVVGTVVVDEKPARSITTDQIAVTAGGVSLRLVGAIPTRDRLTITTDATGTDAVFIGTDQVTPGTGYPMRAGETLTLSARCALYVVAPAGNAALVVVSVLSEHHDG